jgi:small-conductance mechanosensitive channel
MKKKGEHIFALLLALIAVIIIIRFELLAIGFEGFGTLITTKLAGYIPKIIFLIALYFIFRAAQLVLNIILSKVYTEKQKKSLGRLIGFFGWLFFAVITLGVLVGNFTTIFASIGLIGLGLTFALQKPITNFVGWLTILTKNIYEEGDRIQIGVIRGDVKEIQVMNTVLHGLLPNSNTRSHKTITFPNDLVLTQEVENFTIDSNYILDELNIAITYESDYTKAMTILEKIIAKQYSKHKKEYVKEAKEETTRINYLLRSVGRNIKDKKIRAEQTQQLHDDKKEIEEELKQLEVMDKDFKPRVRVEMLDSSINLIAQMLTLYDKVKQNRTAVNLAFLNAAREEKYIDIAYPHMELISHKVKKPEYKPGKKKIVKKKSKK